MQEAVLVHILTWRHICYHCESAEPTLPGQECSGRQQSLPLTNRQMLGRGGRPRPGCGDSSEACEYLAFTS